MVFKIQKCMLKNFKKKLLNFYIEIQCMLENFQEENFRYNIQDKFEFKYLYKVKQIYG